MEFPPYVTGLDVDTTGAAAATSRARSEMTSASSGSICGRFMYSHHLVLGPPVHGHFSMYTTSVPNSESVFSKNCSMPLMTVTIEVTEVMPITMPTIVRADRILCDAMARKAVRNASRSSYSTKYSFLATGKG